MRSLIIAVDGGMVRILGHTGGILAGQKFQIEINGEYTLSEISAPAKGVDPVEVSAEGPSGLQVALKNGDGIMVDGKFVSF